MTWGTMRDKMSAFQQECFDYLLFEGFSNYEFTDLPIKYVNLSWSMDWTGYPWLVAQLDHLCTDHQLFVMINLLVVMTPCTGGEIAAATLNIF